MCMSDLAIRVLSQINIQAKRENVFEIRVGGSNNPVLNIHDTLAAPWGSGPALV